MAGMDYGVISIKDGQLTNDYQGAGASYSLDGDNTFFNRVYFKNYDDYIYFGISIGDAKKKVLHWQSVVKDITIMFKTKHIVDGIYFTTFHWNGHQYKIIHGYDVSLKHFWNKSSKQAIHKLLKTHLNNYQYHI